MDGQRSLSPVASTEREHLAQAHHEICTALTVSYSNVYLLRARLSGVPLAGAREVVHSHLAELEGAVDRLRALARELKARHDALAASAASAAPDAPPALASSPP